MPAKAKLDRTPKVVLTMDQEKQIFLDMKGLSTSEVGRKHGLDFHYPDSVKLRFAVHNIYKKVLAAPGVYGLNNMEVQSIQESVSSRSLRNNPKKQELMVREAQDEFKDTIEGIRNTAADILRRKLATITTKKQLEDISWRDIKDILAMAVDKSRLVGGESTANVVQFSKIDPDMKPEEALALVLKAREAIVEQKNY